MNKENNIEKIWSIFDYEIKNKPCNNKTLSTIDQDVCTICNSMVSLTQEGFRVCRNNLCGFIDKQELDHSPEWRYYGPDDNNISDPTRCGMPINELLLESSYGCHVICSRGNTSYEMRKIRRYTEWQSMPYKEKSQYDEFRKITILANNAGIPKIIINDALIYHKKTSEQKTFRGLNRDGLIAASIYIACRINNYPRSSKEIAQIFNLDNTSATRGCKNAVSIINYLEKDLNISEKTCFGTTTPDAFIDRYCSKLHINNELTKLCHFIALRVQSKNLIPENTPPSIAAGIVYFVSKICDLNKTKKDIKQISKISEVTINKCYKKLQEIQDDLIPSMILDKYNNM